MLAVRVEVSTLQGSYIKAVDCFSMLCSGLLSEPTFYNSTPWSCSPRCHGKDKARYRLLEFMAYLRSRTSSR